MGSFTAEVGGLWDALLGEGRRWFNYANSDYHTHYTVGDDDFYPGEYQKTYVHTEDSDGDGDYSLNEIANGLRSGNAYFANGDLIKVLEFTAYGQTDKAVMGQEMSTKGRRWEKNPVVITIKLKSPAQNNNGDTPVVDHIDLIAGEIRGKIDPSSPDYTNATNETAKVIATFKKDDWKLENESGRLLCHHLPDQGY